MLHQLMLFASLRNVFLRLESLWGPVSKKETHVSAIKSIVNLNLKLNKFKSLRIIPEARQRLINTSRSKLCKELPLISQLVSRQQWVSFKARNILQLIVSCLPEHLLFVSWHFFSSFPDNSKGFLHIKDIICKLFGIHYSGDEFKPLSMCSITQKLNHLEF